MDESGNAHFGSNFRALFRHISVCLYLSEAAWKDLSSLEAGCRRESERKRGREGERERERWSRAAKLSKQQLSRPLMLHVFC